MLTFTKKFEQNFSQKVCKASALQSGSSIFLFAGYGSDAPIQRIDLDGQENLGSTVIGYQPEEGVEYPGYCILFSTKQHLTDVFSFCQRRINKFKLKKLFYFVVVDSLSMIVNSVRSRY